MRQILTLFSGISEIESNTDIFQVPFDKEKPEMRAQRAQKRYIPFSGDS